VTAQDCSLTLQLEPALLDIRVMNQRASHTEDKSTRTVRWLAPLVVVGIVLLFLALLFLEENWRGEVVWRRTKKALEDKGEILDWNHYLPTPPPNERNMMKVPGMSETFIKGNTGGLRISAVPSQGRGGSNYIRYGEIEVVKDPDRAMMPLATLRTNATAQRTLARYFAGRGLNSPYGFYLTERRPGSETNRALIFSRGPVEAKEFENKEGFLKFAPDKVEQVGSNTFALVLHQGLCYGAEEYLAWSASHSNLFAMLDKAAKRPECWLPGDYSIPFSAPIANFINIRTAAQLLGSRVQAFLLLDRPDEAYADLQRIDTLNRIVSAKPQTLVAAMINVAVTGLQISVISDGFAMGSWRERHWRGFIEANSRRQLLPQVVESLRSGERAGVLRLIEQLATDGGRRVVEQDVAMKSMATFFSVSPRGWAPLNAAFYARAVQEQIEALESGPMANPQRIKRMNDEMIADLENSRAPTRMIARIAVINLYKAAQTTSKNQNAINQLVIASALELFRQRKGEYPHTLAELSPEFLERIPNDVVLAKALRYEKRKNGEYALYSIGWNGADDLAPLLANPDLPIREIFESKPDPDDWIWKGVPETALK
jgi:hypothetical protein